MGWFSPMRYSELPRFYRENLDPVDVVFTQVPPMDEHGNFSFSLAPSTCMTCAPVPSISWWRVNKNLPPVYGLYKAELNIADVTYVVEGNNPSIPELGSVPPPTWTAPWPTSSCPRSPTAPACSWHRRYANTVGSLIAESD